MLANIPKLRSTRDPKLRRSTVQEFANSTFWELGCVEVETSEAEVPEPRSHEALVNLFLAKRLVIASGHISF
jgi:hypothetical protein